MPLPFLALPLLIKGGMAIVGTAGAGVAAKGAAEARRAREVLRKANDGNEQLSNIFYEYFDQATNKMEELGKLQTSVAIDFERFIKVFSQIENTPVFDVGELDAGTDEFDVSQVMDSFAKAGLLREAAANEPSESVLGAVAATGLSTAVMALGTASAGVSIGSIAGVAATNATLAALSSGALAAGGAGIAAGTAALGAATLGVGFLVGGIAYALIGSKLKEKAGEAFSAMLDSIEEINNSIKYLARIRETADSFTAAISRVHNVYDNNVKKLVLIAQREKDYSKFSADEQSLLEYCIRVVQVLQNMINTSLLKVDEFDEDDNPVKTVINITAVKTAIVLSNHVLTDVNPT